MGLWSADRVRRFQARLLRWYGRHRRILPWRKDTSPYRVWISEIMLQQTQVRTVLRYFGRFVRRFPDIRSLAAASESDVLEYWAGLGYYARARNIHKAAKKIMAEHGGSFPDTVEAVTALPGVGRYTAGAILSIAFNRPLPVVDGNVRRLICRLHAIKGAPDRAFLWKQAAAWVPEGHASDFNQAVMELGALVCTPANPRCCQCPVLMLCEAERQNVQDNIPAPRPGRDSESVTLAVLLLEWKGRILLSATKALGFVPGEWGLPSVRVAGSTPAKDAAQELARRIAGLTIAVAGPSTLRHAITHRRIIAHVFTADGAAAAERPKANSGYRWSGRPEALRLITSSLFRKAIRRALERVN